MRGGEREELVVMLPSLFSLPFFPLPFSLLSPSPPPSPPPLTLFPFGFAFFPAFILIPCLVSASFGSTSHLTRREMRPSLVTSPVLEDRSTSRKSMRAVTSLEFSLESLFVILEEAD